MILLTPLQSAFISGIIQIRYRGRLLYRTPHTMKLGSLQYAEFPTTNPNGAGTGVYDTLFLKLPFVTEFLVLEGDSVQGVTEAIISEIVPTYDGVYEVEYHPSPLAVQGVNINSQTTALTCDMIVTGDPVPMDLSWLKGNPPSAGNPLNVTP